MISSPPYLSPPPTNVPKFKSTAELLEVLSGNTESEPIRKSPSPQLQPSQNTVQKIDEKSNKPIKIKIKTKLAQEYAANGQIKKSKRATRANPLSNTLTPDKQTSPEEPIAKQTMKPSSPQPGNENYDLYRTLASSPSPPIQLPINDEKDFDSQSSNLGSISSARISGMPKDSRVICSRGSSNVTSDQETSQGSSLMAVPSEIGEQFSTMTECDTTDVPIEQLTIIPTPPPKQTTLKRSTRRQTKSSPSILEQPVVKATRVTRNNNNVLVQVINYFKLQFCLN